MNKFIIHYWDNGLRSAYFVRRITRGKDKNKLILSNFLGKEIVVKSSAVNNIEELKLWLKKGE